MNKISKIKVSLLFVLLEFFSQIKCETQEFAPIVTTKNGKVRGIVKDLEDGTQLYLYDGIPYGSRHKFSIIKFQLK